MRNRLASTILGLAGPALVAAAMPPQSPPPPPLEAYGDLPSVEKMALSVSGELLATVATINGQRQVIAIDAQNRARASALIGNAKVRALDWAGDDFLVLYTSNTTKLEDGYTTTRTEATVGTVLTVDGGRASRIFGDSRQVVDSVQGRYGLRRINGVWYGFYGGLPLQRATGGVHLHLDAPKGFWNGSPERLYAVNLATQSIREAAGSGREGHNRDWLVDERGDIPAYIDYDGAHKTWRIVGPDERSLAEGPLTLGGAGLYAIGKDGTSVIYVVGDEELNLRWYEAPLAGGASKEILAGRRVEAIYVDPLTGRYMGYRDGDSAVDISLVNPAHQTVLRKVLRAFPDLRVEIRDWTPDFQHLLVRTDGNKDSGTWYLVDVAQLRARAVGYERTLIGPNAVGPISKVEYTASDGLAMDGILTLPPGRAASNLPVIVLPHGGPASYDEAEFDWWAQAFASRGYAVFQPNFRGSTNRDAAFERAGDGQWGRKMQTDISDGLAELAKRGVVDPRRACIVGASYGGYAALAGVTLQHGLYRCAAAVAPVADIRMMYNSDLAEAGDSEFTWRGLRRQLGDPSGFEAVSPLRHADAADAPILLIHGKDDTVVPYNQSQAMADALQRAGKPYEMVTLKGEDHWLSRGETRKQMLNAAVAFVQKHNPAD